MKKMIAMCALVAPLFASVAFAQNAPAPAAPAAGNTQQDKMKACNTQASGKKGDDRKAFMKDCLSNKPAAAAGNSQQEKMKACNKDATGKKGDERKAFMKDCLSK
ncbi:PsiF family protein [Cupriavidus sp. 30B13]|uniref:PsiF family protein n=1 Tax=Cupriavidus sp. 30B13 TaxID=3384241 RepID=UPI003B91DB80